ncbi:MAG TPA: hypothetical protein VNT55_09300 [Baekduia sp.]|nr:hypothetical protein [Baekduia sp.]
MDDGPRIGGLQAFCLIVAITAGYVLFGAGVWGALPFLVASVGGVVWLEVHARRRAREEREERERRLRESRFGGTRRPPSPMPPDPFGDLHDPFDVD